MANNATLRKIFKEVESKLASGKYEWVSEDSFPSDYFDLGLSFSTTSNSLIQKMIDEGDLVII